MALEKNWKRYRLRVEHRRWGNENSDAGMFSNDSHAFLGCLSNPHTMTLSPGLTVLCFHLLGWQTTIQKR